MDGAEAGHLYSTTGASVWQAVSREAQGSCCAARGVSRSETALGADLGGSSKYSNESFEN